MPTKATISDGPGLILYKAKFKGLLPAIHRQQALFGCLNNFYFKILSELSDFLGTPQREVCPYFLLNGAENHNV